MLEIIADFLGWLVVTLYVIAVVVTTVIVINWLKEIDK